MMLAKKYAKGKARKKLLEDLKLKKKVDKIGKKASKKDQKKEAEQAEKDIGRWRKGMEERESRQGAKAGKKKDNKKTTDTLGRKIYRGGERKKHEGYIKDVVQPRRRKAKQEAEAKKVGGKELRQLRKEAKLRSAEQKLRHRDN